MYCFLSSAAIRHLARVMQLINLQNIQWNTLPVQHTDFSDVVASQVLAHVSHWQAHRFTKIHAFSLAIAFLPRLISIWPCYLSFQVFKILKWMKKKTPYLSSIFDGLSTMSIKFKPTFEKKSIEWMRLVSFELPLMLKVLFKKKIIAFIFSFYFSN